MYILTSIITSFFITYHLPVRPPKITFVDTLPIISTPYGKRQAHAMSYLGRDRIEIRRDHWRTLGYWQRKELIWHELAHLQGCDHTNKAFRIMNPHAPTIYWVKKDGSNWQALQERLRKYLKVCQKRPKRF